MNTINDIDLNLLKTLNTVYETLNLTRTGERLGLTQSAISHSLKKLRDYFDDPLVIRQGNHLILTTKSEQMVQPLKRWLNDFEQTLLNTESFDPQESHKTFVISTTDLTEQLHIPKLIKLLSRHAPYLQIHTMKWDSRRLVEQLENGEVDFGIGVIESNNSPNIMQTTLYKESFSSMARRGHPFLSSKRTIKDFVSYPHVLASTGLGGKGVVDMSLENIGLKRDLLYRVSNFSSAPYIVEQSNSILTGPRKFIEFAAKRHKVESFDTPVSLEEYPIRIFWHERTHAEKGHKWLRDQIIKICH